MPFRPNKKMPLLRHLFICFLLRGNFYPSSLHKQQRRSGSGSGRGQQPRVAFVLQARSLHIGQHSFSFLVRFSGVPCRFLHFSASLTRLTKTCFAVITQVITLCFHACANDFFCIKTFTHHIMPLKQNGCFEMRLVS